MKGRGIRLRVRVGGSAPARRFFDVAGAVWWRSTHNFATNAQFLLPSIM